MQTGKLGKTSGLMLNPPRSKLQPKTLPYSSSALSETWPEGESLTRRGVPGPLTNFHACRLSSTSFVWQWRHQPPPPAEWPCSALAPAPSGAGRLLHGSWSSPAGNLLRGDTSSGWDSRARPHSATCGECGRRNSKPKPSGGAPAVLHAADSRPHDPKATLSQKLEPWVQRQRSLAK